MFHYNLIKRSLYQMVNNKQLMYTVPTMHRTLPFCIALCLVDLFGSIALVGHDPVLEFDDDGGLGKSLCTRRLRLLDIME